MGASFLLIPARDPASLFDGAYRPKVISRGAGDAPARPQGEQPSASGSRVRRGVAGLLESLGDVLWLRRKLRELRPDIVLTEGTGSQVIHVYLATLFTRLPYAAQIAGSIFALDGVGERSRDALVFRKHAREIRESVYGYRESAPERPPRRDALKRLYTECHAVLKRVAVRNARKLLVHTRQNAWEVDKLYGRPAVPLKGAFPEAIFRHERGQDVRARLGLAARPVVLTLCRHASHKRIDLSLRAFARLKAELPDAVLLVGGRSYGTDAFQVGTGELRALAAELGVERDVRFLGHVPEAELWDTYLACDVFAHMDRANFDIAPYEALALGRRVVWSEEMELDCGFPSAGRVFAATPTVGDTARALREALEAPKVPLDEAAREALRPYTWEEYFRRVLAVLESAVD